MQITHEEARQLIQFSLDKALRTPQMRTLQSHLEACLECRTFAEELKIMENLLVPAMRQHWNLRPIPLSIAAIRSKGKSNLKTNLVLVTRSVMIAIVFAGFVLSTWQFAISKGRTSTPMPVSVLPIPTPSGQSTSTKIGFQNCQEVIYQVQENDTLESIVTRFSASKDRVMAINNLSTETIHRGIELVIPICNSRPTGTVYPSTVTTTFTPLAGSTTSSPGG